MKITQFLREESETLGWAENMARLAKYPLVIFLQGDLGAGKTTFSRGFLRGLGFVGRVKSPTYTLVESYAFDHFSLHHFDFYRVNDPHELEWMGIQDYFTPEAICLIEWPERGQSFLPQPDLICHLSQYERGREIKITAPSLKGESILKRLTHEK